MALTTRSLMSLDLRRGTRRFAAIDPASARMGTIIPYRPTSIANAPVTL